MENVTMGLENGNTEYGNTEYGRSAEFIFYQEV